MYVFALRRLALLALSLGFAAQAGACAFCEAFHADVCSAAATDGGYAATDEVSPFFINQGQWPQFPGDGAPVTVTYSYNNFLNGGMKNLAGVSYSPEFLRDATEEAFALWASVAPLHFVEVSDVGTPVFSSNSAAYQAYDPSDFGQIRISHLYIDGTDEENGMPSPKARAWYPSAPSPLSGDIQFDNGDPWEIVGTSSAPDVLGIMTHEIGHAIGLVHSNIAGTVMFPAALRRNGPGTGILLADDIARVRAVYGEGVGSVTPLTSLVPEGSAAVLAAVGIGGVACRGRRRRAG